LLAPGCRHDQASGIAARHLRRRHGVAGVVLCVQRSRGQTGLRPAKQAPQSVIERILPLQNRAAPSRAELGHHLGHNLAVELSKNYFDTSQTIRREPNPGFTKHF
jgi:hypothetical protein